MKISIQNALKNIVGVSLLIFISSSINAKDVDLSGRSEQDMIRDDTSKPREIIKFSGVKSGDKVLDLLGGGGYYSELLSRVVGDKGEVVLQIPEAYLKYVGKTLDVRLANDRLKNVTYLLSEASDLKLGNNKYDSAYIVMGYHDMFFTEEGWNFTADVVMPQLLKSLKSGGKLLIIDHNTAKGNGAKDAESLHRIESAFVKSDLENRGFRLVKESSELSNVTDDHSLIVFDKTIRRKTDRFIMLFEKPAE